MILPYNSSSFLLRCTVSQTDRFQKDFIEAYDESAQLRRSAKVKMAVIPAAFVAAAALLYFLKDVYNGYAVVMIFFALLFAGYYLYIYLRGYKNEIIDLQKLLAKATDKGQQVYKPLEFEYEFLEDRVEIHLITEGGMRFFEYCDIAYIDETDRMYIVGIKKNNKKPNLYMLDYILIPKVDLSFEEEDTLIETFGNIAKEYSVPLFKGEHPFK